MEHGQDQDQTKGIFSQIKSRLEKTRDQTIGDSSLDLFKKRQKTKLHSLNDLTVDMVLADY